MKGYITQQEPTYVKEVIVDYDDLSTSYTLIHNFGNNSLARAKSTRIGMKNTTDTDIVLKFGSLNGQDNEKTIDAGDVEALDGFKVIGELRAKTIGTPSEGRLKVWVW